MNRPPQRADPWFAQHQVVCGGAFTKIAAPAPVKKTQKEGPDGKKRPVSRALNGKPSSAGASPYDAPVNISAAPTTLPAWSVKGHRLGSAKETETLQSSMYIDLTLADDEPPR